jgi:hypothetical protein
MKISSLAAAIAFAVSPVLFIPQSVASVNVFLDESSLKNDLQGTLSGTLKFAQTHTIDGNDNSSKEMPRLTSTRTTLVMLIPSGASVESMSLTARDKNG